MRLPKIPKCYAQVQVGNIWISLYEAAPAPRGYRPPKACRPVRVTHIPREMHDLIAQDKAGYRLRYSTAIPVSGTP